MASGAFTLRHCILGLLAQKPMSGYDIRRVMEKLGWLIGSPSYGSLYPALHALYDEGLVTVDVLAQAGKPDRKLYWPTEAGRRSLQDWVNQSGPADVTLKAFVMHLLLADSFSADGLIAYLLQRREQILAQQVALEASWSEADEQVGWGKSLALDYGRALASAELNWLDHVLNSLRYPLSGEESQRAKAVSPDLV